MLVIALVLRQLYGDGVHSASVPGAVNVDLATPLFDSSKTFKGYRLTALGADHIASLNFRQQTHLAEKLPQFFRMHCS